MSRYCKIIPDKGAELFLKLKKQLGREAAQALWNNVVTHQDFLNDYKDTLTLDSEGIPTFESLMDNPYIQQKIGLEEVKKALQSQYQVRPNTRTDFKVAVGEAMLFNLSNANKDKFVAIVDCLPNSLQVKIVENNAKNKKIFQDLAGVNTLNNRISLILAPLGITESILKLSGVYGITDFSKAKDFANDLIKVADNYQGEYALSEEFAHLCLEVFKDNPLVARIKNLIKDDISLKTILKDLYDIYNKIYNGNTDKLVDEAMGHMLQDSFFKEQNVPKYSQSLFHRLVNLIKSLFSKVKPEEVNDAVIESMNMMDEVAKNILYGNLKLTKLNIASINRNDELYSLAELNKALIDILSKAVDNEVKMAKIEKDKSAESFINTLLAYQKDDADTALGICMYLNSAMNEMSLLDKDLVGIKLMPLNLRFHTLRRTNNYIKKYTPTLRALSNILAEARSGDSEELQLLDKTFDVDGVTTYTIQDMVDKVNILNDRVLSAFTVEATSSFAEFLKPFMGSNLANPFIKGERVPPIEVLLKEATKDISWVDKWLSSMSESSDVLLLLFNLVAMEAKDKARMLTINDSKEIQSAYLKAQKAGVKDFTFMYRYIDGVKTDLYIGSEEELNNLSQVQKDFYVTFMTIKKRLDEKLDDKNASLSHVIQLKKEHSYGALGLIALGKFNQVGEYFRDKVFEGSYDDLSGFGVNRNNIDSEGYLLDSEGNRILENGEPVKATTKDYQVRTTLKGFDGKEYMLVPKYYLHNIKDLNEVSEDPVGSLIAYSFMANNYKEMDNIVDALETGREILKNRKVKETRGDKSVKERFHWRGLTVDSAVEKEWEKTNIAQKLDMFFNSLIYGRYLKDEGVWNIRGHNANIQKMTSTLLGVSSHILLGFNWLANTANVANGIAMTNIEAASKKYFKPKSLFEADGIYTSLLLDYVMELPNLVKKSKLALIEEYFDTRLNFHENVKIRYDKELLTRVFGPNLAFIGQGAGDHWLYNRVAIAMLLETEALDENKNKSNAYEALEVVVDENGVGRLQIKKGWTIPGIKRNAFTNLGRKIANVNQKLFGIYNLDDLVAAQQVAVGRLALQYRKWIIPALSKRFEHSKYNATLDEWEEGYYRTFGKFLANDIWRELKRGNFLLTALWDSLSEPQKENCRRAQAEIGLFILVMASILALSYLAPKDKERPWLIKFIDYQLRRQQTELGVLIPLPMMLHEAFKIINAPAAGLSAADNYLGLIEAIANPFAYYDERDSGPYKGMNSVEKSIYMNTPYIKSINRATKDIDTAMQYFNK